MAEITVNSLNTAMVKAAMTDYIYKQLMYDGSGIQSVDDVCQNAINMAWSTVQSKAEKAGIGLNSLSDNDAGAVLTAFTYLTESEAQGIAQNTGMYWSKRKQALKLLADLWGSVASDENIDNTSGTPQTFLSATVQPLTYTTKEDKLFNNSIFS